MTPSTYLWDGSNRPALGSMTETGNLSDGGEDDTSTDVSAEVDNTLPGSCVLRSLTSYVTAVADFGMIVDLSDQEWRVTARGANKFPEIIAVCGVVDEDDTPAPPVAGVTIETSPDGTTWTERDGGAINYTPTPSTASGTFSTGITARYVRAVLAATREIFAQTGTWGVVAHMYDFRVVGASGGEDMPPDSTTVTAVGTVEPCGAVGILVSGL